ncbi:DUF6114 domain-containing protein [Streptomyces thinghirensis]|nr:DUF6114 domain-containing protein [Streptomyces thinghirensis]
MKASFKVVLHVGMQGVAGYLLLPIVMLLAGLLALVSPLPAALLLAHRRPTPLGTWNTSNLGGYLDGLLAVASGSCLVFGWLPDQESRTATATTPREGGQAARARPAASGTAGGRARLNTGPPASAPRHAPGAGRRPSVRPRASTTHRCFTRPVHHDAAPTTRT